MGLGKTIQTIALLAHLATSRGIWGPHLIVVPTSVMLNWETEFKRFCPAFKLLTYFGTAKERKAKRSGWSKPNAFHVCITTYRLATQDVSVFRRKRWTYLILDEAHMIKNWRSQRWQTLLHFNTKRRLLLTGTPLQNDLMELWSLMHFLMPHVFASHDDFRAWFANPLAGTVEEGTAVNRQLVGRLHGVLRPFLLRRLKADVEKGLPPKSEAVVRCRLSKRQRRLYEEYMASSDTRGTLASGNLLGIMNCLMQLRKVCNHPDLFAGRPIISAFDTQRLEPRLPALLLRSAPQPGLPDPAASWMAAAGLLLCPEGAAPFEQEQRSLALQPTPATAAAAASAAAAAASRIRRVARPRGCDAAEGAVSSEWVSRSAASASSASARVAALVRSSLRRAACGAARPACAELACPGAGARLRELLACRRPVDAALAASPHPARRWEYANAVRRAVLTHEERAAEVEPLVAAFVFAIPRVRAAPPRPWAAAPLRDHAVAAAEIQTRVRTGGWA